MSSKENDIEKDDIDLSELANKIKSRWKFITGVSLVGTILGIIISFSIPREYSTTIILTTDSGKTGGGTMNVLASMAGINLGGSETDNFSPALYPSVLNSTSFVQSLFNVPVSDTSQGINDSLYNYIKYHQKSTWWSYIFKIPGLLFSSSKNTEEISTNTNAKPRHIAGSELEVIDQIRQSYSISSDKKTGITSLEVTMQSPEISALLADTLASYLQQYIIDKRTQKARTNLVNSEKLYTKAKNDYYDAQRNLASFIDGNLNVISAKFKVNQEKLQNEATIAYTVYTQMAQQVQLNRVKVQDDTPVLTIIQPAVEPIYPIKPKKRIIVVGFLLVSMVGAVIWTLKKSIYHIITDKH